MKSLFVSFALFLSLFSSAYAETVAASCSGGYNPSPYFFGYGFATPQLACAGVSPPSPFVAPASCRHSDGVIYSQSCFTGTPTCPIGYTRAPGTLNCVGEPPPPQVCPTGSTGTYPSCSCTAPNTYNASTNVCDPPPCPANSSGTYPSCTCNSGYTFTQDQTECVNTICPHTYLGIETSSGYGFTSASNSSSYVACDSYGCAVQYSLVAQALGISLYHAVALNYACGSTTSLPSTPLSVTLAPSDPAVTDFVEKGTIPAPMTVVCDAPLVSNAAGDSCMYPDQSPAPPLTCTAPMVLNATGTACLNTTPETPPAGSSGAGSGGSTPAPTCPVGTTMTGGVCVPNAAPAPGTSGNPTNVTGTVTATVQFPGDYAKTGEAATAAAGLGTKLDTLHGDLTGQTTVADPPVLTAADMPGMGSTFDGIKAWTLPTHTSTCPQPQIDLSGVLGAGRVFTLSTHCQIAQDHFPVLQAAMILVWTIAAMFVVLKA